MSVKTFTLATIIYPTWSYLNITSPALVKNGQGGPLGGTIRELGEAKLGGELIDPKLPKTKKN